MAREYKEVVLYASNPIESGTQLAKALSALEEYARIALRTGRTIRVGTVELQPLKDTDRKGLDI